MFLDEKNSLKLRTKHGARRQRENIQKKKIQRRSQGAESFLVGAFINNNGDIPWRVELRVKAMGGNTQTKR